MYNKLFSYAGLFSRESIFQIWLVLKKNNVWNMFKFFLEISLSRTTVEYLVDNINFYSSSISLVILIKP